MSKGLLKKMDEVSGKTRVGGFDSNAYSPLILDDNEEVLVSFLVDVGRSLKTIEHFDKELKRFVLCNRTYFDGDEQRQCEKCNNPDEEVSRDTTTRSFLVFNHSAVGTTRESKSGEKYEVRPVQVYKARMGEAQTNFATIFDANGDQEMYYKTDKTGNAVLDVDLLKKENALLFTEDGKNKIWKLVKTVKGEGKKKKTSYPAIQQIEHRQAQKELDMKDKIVKVPDSIMAAAHKLTLEDLASHYLANIGNVIWEEFGIEAPAEGSRIGDPDEKKEI